MSFEKHGKNYFAPRTLCHFDRLYAWKNSEYFPPVVVEISATANCNQACRYCYVAGRTSGQIKNGVLVKLLPQLASTGVKAVVFQGAGEPFVHRDLLNAVEAGVKSGLSISVTTNGVLLTKSVQERILDKLAYIKFSNLDNSPQRYAFIHGCPEKQWEMMMENIKNAVTLREQQSLDIFFLATVYITKENFEDIYNTVKYLKELGIDYVSIQEAVYNKYSYAGIQPLASSYFTGNEINKMKNKILTLKDKDFFVKIRFPLIDETFINGRYKDCWINNWCQGIKFNTLIDSDGEVYACFRYWGMKDYSYGNIYKNSFEEIWRGEKRKQVEKHTNSVPPENDECSICNVTKINEILKELQDSHNKFRNFLI